MDSKERISILKALSDGTRLMLVNALLEKPHCVEDLAQRLRRAPSTISFHLRKLEEAGLVSKTKTQYYLMYELRLDLLQMNLRDFIAIPADGESPERKRMQRYREKVVRTFIRNQALIKIPKQWKKRRIILEEFLKKFESGKEYRENEVNERIMTLYSDYCTIRRMLIDEGYMSRQGQIYRVEKKEEVKEKMKEKMMSKRADIKREYKQTPLQAGIYQIKNTVNGKVFLGSSTNLHGPLNRDKFMLSTGMHKNEQLQKDWKEFGPGAFSFDILEIVKQKDDPNFSLEDELTLLEQIWIEKLQPFGEHGYNKIAKIREAYM
ncbi:MAG: metalloregulator ArsR/SmtB family transcription factor [Bacteroidota bacterium]